MSTQSTEANSKQKKGGTILIICAIIIILLLAMIIWLLVRDTGSGNEVAPSSQQVSQPAQRSPIVNESNVDEIISSMAESPQVPVGSYEVKMNSTWYFENGEAVSRNAYVENVANNTNNVYFDLQLMDTEEVILESPLLTRGSYMNKIKLDKDLDAGTYDCVLIYHLVDDAQNTLSTLRMGVTVVVEG